MRQTIRQYYRARHLADRYGVHASTIWRWAREGIIPPPRRIGGVTVWAADDIEAADDARTTHDALAAGE